MTSILVTGGAGFIGSHTCKALAAESYFPVVFDNLSRGHAGLVRWGPLVQGDILDSAALDGAFSTQRPDAVIHFAALAYVGESVVNPVPYYKTNVAGLTCVLEAMLKHGVRKIVFSSSCAIYGIPDTLPIPESAPQNPISAYGYSKLACERILTDVAQAHDLQFVILRYFNASGADPSGELTEIHNPETHLIPLAIDAAKGKAPLQVFGMDYATKDGTCERDYVHVCDLASAHVRALQHLLQGGASMRLNLGSGRPYSVLEVVGAVERLSGKHVPIVKAARRPGDPPRLFADATLARDMLGIHPQLSDLETIVKTAWASR